MSKVLRITIPEDTLSASDIVGRAVRLTRLNWLPLLTFLLLPTFINDFASSVLVFDPSSSTPGVSVSLSYWLIVSAFVLLCFTTWELGIRRFALLLCIAKANMSLEEAMKAARKRLFLVLFLVTPVIITEIFTACFFLFLEMIVNALTRSDAASEIQSGLVLFMLFMMFALMVPILSVWVVNSFFLSILVYENTTVQQTIARFFRLAVPVFPYFCIYTILMACAYVSVFFPSMLSAAITFFFPKNIVASIIEFTITSTFESPIYAFLSAAVTIGSACLYKQIVARLEGQDILNKLAVSTASPRTQSPD